MTIIDIRKDPNKKHSYILEYLTVDGAYLNSDTVTFRRFPKEGDTDEISDKEKGLACVLIEYLRLSKKDNGV